MIELPINSRARSTGALGSTSINMSGNNHGVETVASDSAGRCQPGNMNIHDTRPGQVEAAQSKPPPPCPSSNQVAAAPASSTSSKNRREQAEASQKGKRKCQSGRGPKREIMPRGQNQAHFPEG